ncbi:aliphatic sulfonate ABC transporter substrate-binding protein [Pseudomonas matsuisoli]|uniref:Putative aliphatic sulfonates-binding protein n=1 Tax=Pseudomonas matsuisoli TaxID=1515666 RepID=A0A917PN45_9PSED|nr:aliphatic sulfonate ABC transporter substrate-binding protein [Pseudomonas matsuisoli]GGJ84837.1 hypothetical protein GCM10009304_08540 [Pseudomonas matsuisoli]
MPANRLIRFFGAAALCTAFGLSASTAAHAESLLRIGYQKSSTLMVLLKQQGTLEKQLAGQGVRVSWHEFASGQPLLEALNVGNVDLSADVADTVPVFAQAAGGNLTYFASESASPDAQAILVGQDSPIKSLADLKGKTVAVTKAAGAHYLLLAALQKGGLKFNEIQPAYLTIADGRAAFENNKVDAWVAWEPFLSAAQQHQPTRVLEGSEGLAAYKRYYLAGTDYAKANPAILKTVFDDLAQAGKWVKANPAEAAKTLGPLWGNLDPAVVEQANARRTYDVQPVTREGLAEQQKIADAFFGERLIPKKIDAVDVEVWAPGS